MRRSIILSVLPFLVGGCVGGSMAPGELPKGVASGVYTTGDPQTVATCIATALGSTVQPDGDRLVVPSVRHPGLTYSVGPNAKGVVYPTQVAIVGGVRDTEDAASVDGCFIARGRVS